MAPLIKVVRTTDGNKAFGEGIARIERVVGHSVEWQWDGRKLTVRSDRFGFQPLFYHASGQQIIVSESLEAVVRAGAPREYDEVALAVFLRLGYFVGNDTPFRGVRTLPPDCVLAWTDGELTLRRTTRPPQATIGVDRTKAIDGFIERFRETIRELIEPAERAVVPLSGGRDSRHILLELLHQGHPPAMTLTLRDVPPRYVDESVVARQLATAAGLPHRTIDPPRGMLKRELRRNRLTHFCADEHAWLLPVADAIRGHYDTIYDGLSGGVVAAGNHLSRERLRAIRKGRYEALAEELLGPERRLTFVLPADVRRRLTRAKARRRVAEELKRHADRVNPVSEFIFMNRIRREIALTAFAILSDSARVKTPFIAPDLVEYMFSLPPEYFLDHTFHTEAIHRTYPSFADIPFQTEIGRAGVRGYSRYPAIQKIKRRLLSTRHARQFVGDIYRYARQESDPPLADPRLLPLGLAYDYLLMAGYAGVGTLSIYLNQLDQLRKAPVLPLPAAMPASTVRSPAASGTP